eukprot:gene1497-1740_t
MTLIILSLTRVLNKVGLRMSIIIKCLCGIATLFCLGAILIFIALPWSKKKDCHNHHLDPMCGILDQHKLIGKSASYHYRPSAGWMLMVLAGAFSFVGTMISLFGKYQSKTRIALQDVYY